MNALIFETNRSYLAARTANVLRRLGADERGSATAEQIMLIGAAVAGAAAVGVIIWNKMQAGANNIETPAP